MSDNQAAIEAILDELIEKMTKFEERVGTKIGILNAESGLSRSPGFGGTISGKIFGGSSIVGGVIGRLKNKIFNSLGGQIFEDLKVIFGEGFSLNRFLDLVIKYMLLAERRSRAKREEFNPILINVYDEYEELVFGITSDPNDLIFISKIALEDLDGAVEEKEEIIEEIENLIQTIESELDNLGNPYYEQNNLETKKENFKKASEEILDAIMEIGEVDVNFAIDRENFDSNSYTAAQKNIQEAIDFLIPSTTFNDVVFKDGSRALVEKIGDFQDQIEDIVERKTLIEDFFENYKEFYSDQPVDNFLLKEIIVEMRSVKDLIDSLVEKGGSSVDTFKEEVLARLFAIKVRLFSTKQDIISSLEELENIDPNNDPQNLRENLNFFEDMITDLSDITEDVDEDSSELENIISTLNKENFNLTRKENSDPLVLRGALDDLKVIVNKHKLRRLEYSEVVEAFTPRENPDLENSFRLAKIQGYLDIVNSIKKGDWKSVFDYLSNGNFGLSDLQSRINVLLSSGSGLTKTTRSVLQTAGNVVSSFENNVVQPLTNRKDIIETATCDLEMEKEELKKIRGQLEIAKKREKDRQGSA